jgi:hypothetical protein
MIVIVFFLGGGGGIWGETGTESQCLIGGFLKQFCVHVNLPYVSVGLSFLCISR